MRFLSTTRAYYIVLKILAVFITLNFVTLFSVSYPQEKLSNNVNWLTLFNIRPASAQTLKQTLDKIDSEAAIAEAQLDKQLLEVEASLKKPEVRNELDKQKAQLRAHLKEILNNEERYKYALEDSNLSQDIKDVLRKARTNPAEIDKFIQEKSNPKFLAEKQRLEIRKRRDLAKKQARDRALRMRLPLIKK